MASYTPSPKTASSSCQHSLSCFQTSPVHNSWQQHSYPLSLCSHCPNLPLPRFQKWELLCQGCTAQLRAFLRIEMKGLKDWGLRIEMNGLRWKDRRMRNSVSTHSVVEPIPQDWRWTPCCWRSCPLCRSCPCSYCRRLRSCSCLCLSPRQ